MAPPSRLAVDTPDGAILVEPVGGDALVVVLAADGAEGLWAAASTAREISLVDWPRSEENLLLRRHP